MRWRSSQFSKARRATRNSNDWPERLLNNAGSRLSASPAGGLHLISVSARNLPAAPAERLRNDEGPFTVLQEWRGGPMGVVCGPFCLAVFCPPPPPPTGRAAGGGGLPP